MRKALTTIAALAACTQLSGCFFVFIPGSVVGKISDGITGAEGEHCVGREAVVGSRIRNPATGEIMVVKSLSGTSMRCTDSRYPIRAAMAVEATAAPSRAVTRETLTTCRDFDRASRKGNWAEEQAAKRQMAQLSLSEADCRSIISSADS